MPDLKHSFQGQDLGYLKIVADLWGVELNAEDIRIGIKRLIVLLVDSELAAEVVASLDGGARSALNDLMRDEGRLPWAMFIRRYGDIEEMGSAKRDREQPHMNPEITPSEVLWYRALVGRTFFDTPQGPIEYAYIPDEFQAFLPEPKQPKLPFGRQATVSEISNIIYSNDLMLDDICTVLSGLRVGISEEHIKKMFVGLVEGVRPYSVKILIDFLDAAKMLDEDGLPETNETRILLESDRKKSMALITRNWRTSERFNELRHLPRLVVEGEWMNNPRLAREAVIGFILGLPWPEWETKKERKPGKPRRPKYFWNLASFIESIKTRYPDYLRPSGDYDSWYVKDERSGEYLRGFTHWDDVEGAFLHYMITGQLFWLGLVDLASPIEPATGEPRSITAFRLSRRGAEIYKQIPPVEKVIVDEKITVRADGRIRAPFRSSRAARYQISRFCDWQGVKDGFFRYMLTPGSLSRAQGQGLNISQLLVLLNRFAVAIPPNLIIALERWAEHGSQVVIAPLQVLQVKN